MLLECTTKSEVVASLTPHLGRVLCSHDDDLVLVNSEKCTWSAEFDTWYPNLDLFVCHKAQYERQETVHSNTASKFGILSKWCLLDSLAAGLIAHVQISETACCDATERLIRSKPYGKVVLFDRSEFWLIDSEDQPQESTVKMKWSEEGSEKALAKFVREPVDWIEMLKAARTKMEVNVMEGGYLRGREDSRTFRVHRANDTSKELALKIAMGQCYIHYMGSEYERMANAAAECSLLVMGVEAFESVSFRVGDEVRVGAALLLSQAGKRVKRSSSIEVYTTILQSLFALHQRDVIHGNPVWDNVVEVDDGSFRWVNFGLCTRVHVHHHELAETIPEFKSLSNDMQNKIAISQHEVTELTASMLQHKYDAPPELKKKIATYTGTDDPHQEDCRNAIIASLVEHVKEYRKAGLCVD
jgi:hypothetical protein